MAQAASGTVRGPSLSVSWSAFTQRWVNGTDVLGHVRDFNLFSAGNAQPVLNVAGTPLRDNELFLSAVALPEVQLAGQLSLSPGAEDVLVLDYYEVRDVRMDMWGRMVPVRWHFGPDKAQGPRFFAEAGLGVDVLRMQATYDLVRSSITMDIQPLVITLTRSISMQSDVVPLDGELDQSVVFTRAMVGGGVDLGRFRVFLRLQRTVSAALEQDGDTFRRVRGNVFARDRRGVERSCGGHHLGWRRHCTLRPHGYPKDADGPASHMKRLPGGSLLGPVAGRTGHLLPAALRPVDLTAFTLCNENKLPIIVFDMNKPGNLGRLIAGQPVGTLVEF